MAHGHARAWLTDSRADLVACADLFPDTAATFASEFGIPATYTDYREMLETERPDVISICTHHPLHAPMTIDAAHIATPQAILCEKPIALDLASADAMIAACQESGTRLIVGHQRRYDRQSQPVKQALDAGRIGEVLFVEAFGHAGSSLLVDSTHTVDLVRYFLGDPRGAWVLGQIDAREHRSAWGQQIEDCALAWIGFDNGVRLLLGAGSIAGDTAKDRMSISPRPITGGTYHRIVIHGTTGRIVLNGDAPNGDEPLVTLHRGKETEVLYSAAEFHADPGWSSVASEVRALLDCLDQPGLPHLLEAESARTTLEILMAIYESSRVRRAVRIPEDNVPDNPLISMLAAGSV